MDPLKGKKKTDMNKSLDLNNDQLGENASEEFVSTHYDNAGKNAKKKKNP